MIDTKYCLNSDGSVKDGYVDISGLDKAILVKALHDQAQVLGMGIYHYKPEGLTVEQIRELLPTPKVLDYSGGNIPGFHEPMIFDYLQGRVMKVDVGGDYMNTSSYNRDNGNGLAEKIVTVLQQQAIASK